MPTQQSSKGAAGSPHLAKLIHDICPLEGHPQKASRGRTAAARRVGSPAAADASQSALPAQARTSPSAQSKSTLSPGNAGKQTPSQQGREAALQQLRMHEKAQLQKLKLLKQQRHAQRLLEEQQQAQELYKCSNFESAACNGNAAASPPAVEKQSSNKLSPKKRQRSPSPAAVSGLTALGPMSLGKGATKLQQIFNPVSALPSFSSVQQAASKTTKSSSSAKAGKDKSADAGKSQTGHAEQPSTTSITDCGVRTAAATAAGNSTKTSLLAPEHSTPAAEQNNHKQLKQLDNACDAVNELKSAAAKKAAAYEKPWRHNMAKKPKAAVSQQPGSSGNGSPAVGAASSAAAQLLAAAADASKPVMLKSKKRTPEEQAKLQEFMATKYQEHLQKELEEKQQQEQAAARRRAVKELAAQQREAARQHQQQNTGTWQPERAWKGVLTPSSEGSREQVADAADCGQPEQQMHMQEQQQQQQWELQQQQQFEWQQRQQHELHQLQKQWQQQQQQQQQQWTPERQQQQHLNAVSLQGGLQLAPQLEPAAHQQQVQQPPWPNVTWQNYQPQQKQQRHGDQSVVRAHMQSLGGMDIAGSGQQHLHGSPSPERSRKGAASMQHSLHQVSRDVSPGKAYLQDRQAVLAANVMAKRDFEQRVRNQHRPCTLETTLTAPSQSAARSPHRRVAAAWPVVASAGARLPAGSAVYTPEKSQRLLATALKSGGSSSGSGSSRKGSRTPGKKKSRSRLHRNRAAAGPPAVVDDKQIKQLQKRRRRLQQQQQAEEVAEYERQSYESSSDEECAIVEGSDSEGFVDRSPSPVRDQTATNVAAACCGADAAEHRETALGKFWAQQRAADHKHVSNNAMIKQLLQQSNLLKQRIEFLAAQALQQRQQQQVQDQHRASHAVPANPGAPSAAAQIQSDVPGAQQLAERLLSVLDEKEQQILANAAPSSALKQDLYELKPPAAAGQPFVGSSESSPATMSSDGSHVAAHVDAAERSGFLSAEGSKAWQQRLREQLLNRTDEAVPSSVQPLALMDQAAYTKPTQQPIKLDQQCQQPPFVNIASLLPHAQRCTTGGGSYSLQPAADEAAAALEQQQPDGSSQSRMDSDVLVEQATPISKQATHSSYSDATYSSSSSGSSGLADHAPISPVVCSSHQLLSFVGAFTHLEVAAGNVGDDISPAQCVSPTSRNDLPRSRKASGTMNATPSTQAADAGAAGDRVVTWYSGIGGSIDFGSPEPPSPDKDELPVRASITLQSASMAAAAKMAATEAYIALRHQDTWNSTAAGEKAGTGSSERDGALHHECNASSSSSTSGISNGQHCHQRKRWNCDTSQQLGEGRQAQQQQQWLAAASADEGSSLCQNDRQEDVISPKGHLRPSWAAAGLGGYRWDTVSSSSLSDNESASPLAAVTCERLVQQHEALQQQQQLCCIPRRDKALANDPRHHAQQARLAIQSLHDGASDDDAEQQQQLPIGRTAKGDPYSIINIFMKQHQQRMQRQQQEQEKQQQLLLEKHHQEMQQQQQELDNLHLQHVERDKEQAQQQSSHVADVSSMSHAEAPEQQVPHTATSESQRLADQLMALLDKQQHHSPKLTTAQLPQSLQPPEMHKQGVQQQQLQQEEDCGHVMRAVSPSEVRANFAADAEQQAADAQLQKRQQLGLWPTGQHEKQQHDDLDPDDWLQGCSQRATEQQLRIDMADVEEPSLGQQQQQRKRLSPNTLQRMHEEGLAKLETAQEAELDLLLLQQAHERVTLQQEAARVARELDQQQLFTLLQQQQQAAAQEQIEHSAGLFQRVTKGLLDDTFGQLKDVSSMFVEHMRDASRRSCGVQANEPGTAVQDVESAVQAEMPRSPGQLQQQAATAASGVAADIPELTGYSQDEFEIADEQAAAAAASGTAGWTVVLPQDEPHPVLHFQALLMAEQHAAATTTAGRADSDVSEVSDAAGAAAFQGSDSGTVEGDDEDIVSAAACPDGGSVVSIDAQQLAASLQYETSSIAYHSAAEPVQAAVAAPHSSASLDTVQEAYDGTVIARTAAASAVDAAAAAATSGSQQYGSSSFESYGDSRPSHMVQQQHKETLSRAILEQQLAEAKQQLSELALHIDAVMVGYAVQALQASKHKAKQAAIHAQALKEQQESAVQKQQLMHRIYTLHQQLGLRPSLSDSDSIAGEGDLPPSATAAAFLAQAATAAGAAAGAPAEGVLHLASTSAPAAAASVSARKQWQKPALPTAAAAAAEQDNGAIVEEESFGLCDAGSSSVSLASSVSEGSLAAGTTAAVASQSTASQDAGAADDYSEDFDMTAVAESASHLSPAAEAAARCSSAEPLSVQDAVAAEAATVETAATAASTASFDSLDMKQQHVAALQQNVARELEKKRLDQQQAALQQLLQQLSAQPTALGGAETEQLLAAAGLQAPVTASMVVSGAAKSSKTATTALHDDTEQLAQSAITAAEAASVSSKDASDEISEEAGAGYSDDFASAAVDEHDNIDELMQHIIQPQQQQQQGHLLDQQQQQQGPVAHALSTASSISSSVCSVEDDVCQGLVLSASELSQQLLSNSDIEVGCSDAAAGAATAAASAVTESLPGCADEAAASAVTESHQDYTDDGFVSYLSSAATANAAAATVADSTVSTVKDDAEEHHAKEAAASVVTESWQGYTDDGFVSDASHNAAPQTAAAAAAAAADESASISADAITQRATASEDVAAVTDSIQCSTVDSLVSDDKSAQAAVSSTANTLADVGSQSAAASAVPVVHSSLQSYADEDLCSDVSAAAATEHTAASTLTVNCTAQHSPVTNSNMQHITDAMQQRVVAAADTAAATAAEPGEVYSYELSASEVGTELLDESSLELELQDDTVPEYAAGFAADEPAAVQVAAVAAQPAADVMPQQQEEQYESETLYTMEFGSSTAIEKPLLLSSSDHVGEVAAAEPADSCRLQDVVKQPAAAAHSAIVDAVAVPPAISPSQAEQQLPQVSSPEPSSVNESIAESIAQQDSTLEEEEVHSPYAAAEFADSPGCEQRLSQHLPSDSCTEDLKGIMLQEQEHHERDDEAAAMQDYIDTAQLSLQAESAAAVVSQDGWQPEQQQPVVSAAAPAADEDAVQHHQDAAISLAGTHAAAEDEQHTAGAAVSASCSGILSSRQLMRASTCSSIGEGSYITTTRGFTGRTTGDSIDLEYSDWTVDQQLGLSGITSYDLAADAVPAEAAAQASAEAVAAAPAAVAHAAPAVSAGDDAAAAAAAAAGLSMIQESVDAEVAELTAPETTAENVSGSPTMHPDAAAEPWKTWEGSAVVVDTHPAAMVLAAGDCHAAAVPSESVASGEDGHDTYSYSMDFASMSMQQSVIDEDIHVGGVTAVTASGSNVVTAGAATAEAAVTAEAAAAAEATVPQNIDDSTSVANGIAAHGSVGDELPYMQRLEPEAAQQSAMGQQQQQQHDRGDLAEALCTATLNSMLNDVLDEALHMWADTPQQQQQAAHADLLVQQQTEAEASQDSVGSGSSAETADSADSSTGSKSIQPDWLSSPGSPPAHLSPLSMRAAAAAGTAARADHSNSGSSSSIRGNISASDSSGLVSHPPTDWTPMSDDLATPWSVEAASSSRFAGAATAVTAAMDDDSSGLLSTVRQLDPLLSEAVFSTPAAGSSVGDQAAAGLGLDQKQKQASLSSSATNAAVHSSMPTAAGDDFDGAAGAALAVSSARADTAADDEFDWPDATEVVSPGSPAASTAAAAAAIQPAGQHIQRRTPSPPPPIVDDSPSHNIAYVQAVLNTQVGPPIHLPEVLSDEPLGLDRYLWLEKDGQPEMSKLCDGSDSDDRHIYHKALYDAANQAIMQVYAAANRLQLHPVCEAAAPAKAMRPLPSQQQLAAEVSAKVAGWCKMRVKDEIGLEKMLAEDAQEDEKVWADRQTEIAEVALEVERGIWEELLADTAATIMLL